MVKIIQILALFSLYRRIPAFFDFRKFWETTETAKQEHENPKQMTEIILHGRVPDLDEHKHDREYARTERMKLA